MTIPDSMFSIVMAVCSFAFLFLMFLVSSLYCSCRAIHVFAGMFNAFSSLCATSAVIGVLARNSRLMLLGSICILSANSFLLIPLAFSSSLTISHGCVARNGVMCVLFVSIVFVDFYEVNDNSVVKLFKDEAVFCVKSYSYGAFA